MFELYRTSRFKKDFKRIQKQGRDIHRFDEALLLLMSRKVLSEKFHDHALTGNWGGHRECHLAPDWLLIYRMHDDVLELVRTGSHAELFL